MKNLTFLATVLGIFALVVGCSHSPKNAYTVTGSVPSELQGHSLSVIDVLGDSALAVIESLDSQFTISGNADIPTYARVIIDGNRKGIELILEPGDIAVDLAQSTAGGTASNDALASFLAAYGDAMEALYTLTDTLPQADTDSLATVYIDNAKNIIKETIVANPDNLVGALALVRSVNLVEDYNNPVEFYEMYEIAGPTAQNFQKVVDYKNTFDRIKLTQPGCKFIDITVPTGAADSTAVSLSDYVGKGKYTLVDFWASWCGPCRREVPVIKEAYERYAGDNFDVLGVDVRDTRADAQRAMETMGMAWPQIYDASFDAVYEYGSIGIPTIILFDPEGVIVARDLRGDQLLEAVASAVGKK